jgi:hypothetical protein
MTKPEQFYKAVAISANRRSEPTPDELARINAFARRRLEADEVYVGECDLCNDRVDRTFEWFPVPMLRQFAASAQGKSLLAGHDYRSLPLGLWYDAGLRGENGTTLLHAKYYVVKTEENAHLRAQLDGGVYRHASIGFTAEDLVCDLCGASLYGLNGRLCNHRPGRTYAVDGAERAATYHYAGRGEMVEESIVYLGCQHDAEMRAAESQKSFDGIVLPRRAGVDELMNADDALLRDAVERALGDLEPWQRVRLEARLWRAMTPEERAARLRDRM